MSQTHERRRFERVSATRPCKLYHPVACRFAPAVTRNISAGGTLIETIMGRELSPGEVVELIVSTPSTGVVPTDELVRARVVRAGAVVDGRQVVALEYLHAAALAEAA